jgi:hypothetical protein
VTGWVSHPQEKRRLCTAHVEVGWYGRTVCAARNILRFAVTPERGEGVYPDARGGVHPLREGALAPSAKDSGEARTENRLPSFREGHAAEDHDDPRLS